MSGSLHEQLKRFRATHAVREATIDGRRWTYLTGGRGPDTVLYLPGGAGRAEAAFAHLGELEQDRRFIAVSYPPVDDLDTLVDGLAGLLELLDVAVADVWGTSFGGMVAQWLSRRHPRRLRDLVLANTAAPSAARARKVRAQRHIARALPAPVLRWSLRRSLARALAGGDPSEREFWSAYPEETLVAEARHTITSLSALSAEFYEGLPEPDGAALPARVLPLFFRDDELCVHARPAPRALPRGRGRDLPRRTRRNGRPRRRVRQGRPPLPGSSSPLVGGLVVSNAGFRARLDTISGWCRLRS